MNRVPTRLNCAGDLRPPATTKTQAPGPWACEMLLALAPAAVFCWKKNHTENVQFPAGGFHENMGGLEDLVFLTVLPMVFVVPEPKNGLDFS